MGVTRNQYPITRTSLGNLHLAQRGKVMDDAFKLSIKELIKLTSISIKLSGGGDVLIEQTLVFCSQLCNERTPSWDPH